MLVNAILVALRSVGFAMTRRSPLAVLVFSHNIYVEGLLFSPSCGRAHGRGAFALRVRAFRAALPPFDIMPCKTLNYIFKLSLLFKTRFVQN